MKKVINMPRKKISADLNFHNAEDGVKELCRYIYEISKENGKDYYPMIRRICDRIKSVAKDDKWSSVPQDKETIKHNMKININESMVHYIGLINCIENVVIATRNSLYYGYDMNDSEKGK